MTAKPKLAVLGGSSPFTAGLIEAIVEAGDALPPHELVLQGRSRDLLDAMTAHAHARLAPRGWTVHATTSREVALDGAGVVLHQVRYGGMEERAQGEQLASRHGVASDETLGPAALRCALRTAPALAECARDIARLCPQAWIVNLTNPLSVTTALLAEHGAARTLGLCELPFATMTRAARRLGIDPARARWSYVGLNHRGFIHRLSAETGPDRIVDLAADDQGLDGVPPEDIRELGVLPLKYFRLLSRRTGPAGSAGPVGPPGRAGFLARLRADVLAEIARAPAVWPPSLSQRMMEWYPLAVVPFLAALAAGDGRSEVVNVVAADGIVRELRARVFADRLEPLEAPPPPVAAAQWLARFEAHERASLAAVRSPTPRAIAAALACDPLVAEAVAPVLARALVSELEASA